ncbi:MAG: replicative DNA helicase [Acetatifactor sp.]|nr:replicative DNA helicase [Acetatifactor sp.]
MSYLAEQNVIGSLLLDKNCMDDIYNVLSADMFTSELLGRIYLEFQRGYDNHYDVNPVMLVQKLGGDHFPESLVLEEIKNCTATTITSASVKSYAEVVVNDHKAKCFNKILDEVKVTSSGVDGQIGKLISQLEGLIDGKNATSKTLSEIVRENKDSYFKDNEAQRTYIGLPKLDDMLGGLEGGDVIVIGARPGVGKSALVTQITDNLSAKGKRVGFYNLEMKDKQVYERFVASHSGIGLTRLRRAKQFLGDEKERFDRANEFLEKKDNVVITTGSKAVSEIRTESRHMGYDVIVIDYLQLLKADKEYRGNRTAEVGAISNAIKALAMELNIPIIVLSQLNRVSEARETKEPTMAELREAGDIEQDASIIILMWNLDSENKSKKGCKVEKNRQGETGRIVLNFNGDLMRFEEQDGGWNSVKPEDDCPFK